MQVFGPPGSSSLLSPFRMQEVQDRVNILEETVARQGHDVAELQRHAHQVRVDTGCSPFSSYLCCFLLLLLLSDGAGE